MGIKNNRLGFLANFGEKKLSLLTLRKSNYI